MPEFDFCAESFFDNWEGANNLPETEKNEAETAENCDKQRLFNREIDESTQANCNKGNISFIDFKAFEFLREAFDGIG